MARQSAELFNELVARGAVSPHDHELRAQIARAEALAGMMQRGRHFVGSLLTGHNSWGTHDVTVPEPADAARSRATPANANRSDRNAA